MSVRILLADDHDVIRAGLRNLLAGQDDLEVVAEAEEGRSAVRLARELSVHLVVMDITMPGLNGLEATRQILADAPTTKVIALSMHADRQFISGMLHAGASGYLLKNSAARELVPAIRAALCGDVYLSPKAAALIVKHHVRRPAEPSESSAALTPREREVLQLLAEGHANKEIAATLSVGPRTIETHRAAIMDKLNIRTLAGLTKYAIQQGLTTPEP